MSEQGKKIFFSLSEAEQKTLVGKIKSLINDLLNWVDGLLNSYESTSTEARIMREYKEQLQKASKVWDEMLKQSVVANQSMEKSGAFRNNNFYEDDVRLSDKDYDYWLDKIETISDEDALKTKSEITYLRIADSTPNILQKYGAMNLPLIIRFDAMYLAQRGSGAFEGHYHHLGKDVMGNLLDYISNPDAILKTVTTNKNGEEVIKLVALVSIPIKSGEALVSIEINTVKDRGEGDESYNLVVTFFDYKENYLRNLFAKYGAETKYKKETLSQDNPKLHKWLGTIEESASNDSILNPDEKVKKKISNTDSTGRELSKGQMEYFKDSTVRDENGNLLVVYHGSPESFTIFDTHKDTSSIIYDASFFTSDESRAIAYANKNNTTGQVYKGYLNVKNPLMPSKVREQISLIPDRVKGKYQSEFDIKDAVSKTDYAIIDFAKYVARKENSTMATVLKSWGFDGYINGKDYAIFESEQFKDIDNTNPTRNPDFRFSERDNEYMQALESGDGDRQITIEMSENERYEMLKNKKINPPTSDVGEDLDIDFKYLEKNIKSTVEKGLLKKFQELGLLKTYKSIAIGDISFDFTGKGYRKSIHSQENVYGGNKADFAKVILSLQNLLDASVLLEIHPDKGKGTNKEKHGLDKVYVLFSALNDGGEIIPVQFEVEQYVNDENRLYLAVALTKIETGVKGNTAPDVQKSTSLLPISNISISKIFEKINPQDANFLKYIPSQFLNEEQIKAKEQALEKDRIKYSRGVLFSDRDTAGMGYSERDYSYDELIAKPDMKLTILDTNVPNNRADIVYEAKKNAAKVGTINTKDKTVSVFVDDIGKDIVIGTKGLQHGLRRLKTLQTDANSFATLKAGEIIKNSVRINEMTPKNENADSSYVLIGAARSVNGDLYIVQSVINQFSNELMSMDVLYAVNAKKENQPRSMRPGIQPPVTGSTISIADLLDYVNKYFPDVLPEDVLKHYGYDARPEGEIGKSVLFSDREDTGVYDIMGETERVKKENEKFKEEIERLRERLKIERQVTHGNYFNENQLGAVAGHLRNISNSNYDKVKLMKSLKDVYSFIAHSENLTWEEVFRKCYVIADDMLAEAKPQKTIDDYCKHVLKEIRNTKISLTEEQKREAQNIFDKHWNRYFFGRVVITYT